MTNEEFVSIINKAIENYTGDVTNVGRAVGMLATGRRYGWRVTYLMYSRTTIRNYEKMLGVSIQDVLPEKGDLAENSYAWKALQTVDNFWKAVKGEIPGIRSTLVKKH